MNERYRFSRKVVAHRFRHCRGDKSTMADDVFFLQGMTDTRDGWRYCPPRTRQVWANGEIEEPANVDGSPIK